MLRSTSVMRSVIRLVTILAMATFPGLWSEFSLAQPYPSKQIRLVSPFGAGGSADTIARLVGQRLSEVLRQQVIIDARPGAGTLIGTDVVAKSVPDGYTLLLASSGSAAAVSVYAKVPYNLVTDFATVGLVGYVPDIFVIPLSVPARSLKEFIQLARAKPKELNFSSSGNGTGSHLAGELFKSMAKIDVVHVPYKAAVSAVTAVIEGEVSMMIVGASSVVPHIKSGKLRALGITVSQRSSLFPEIPTISEAGLPGYECIEWFGVLAPAGTSGEVIGNLNTEISKIVQTAEMKSKFAAVGAEPLTNSPEQFASYLRSEIQRYAKIVQEANIRAE
jgi:tripartite-type tricarboxylate transporter receptor subunit TctC